MDNKKDKAYIVKIGGHLIDSADLLDRFLEDFARLEAPKVLVHGGGKIATELSRRLGIVPKMHMGRRITDSESLEVVTMVYAGLLNKQITAKLQARGCNALGISGADGNTIAAKKRPANPVDFGWVGDVQEVNAGWLDLLMKQNAVPVLCAISHDRQGQLLNINADTVASEVAIALSEYFDTELVYCFEKNGVLEDVKEENSVIPHIDFSYYEKLKREGIIQQGMLPKIDNCFHALEKQVGKVRIGNAFQLRRQTGSFTLLTL
ncbi:MAG: acetylglutamate kinase [Cytophagales bacterium]|nr:acetylglutamate kinase [Cytophagales bacterium]